MNQKVTVKKIFKYLTHYKLSIIFSLLFAFVTVAGQLAIPVLQGKAIDRIIGAGNVDIKGIITILIIIAVTVVATALFQWIMNVINNKITYSIVRDIRKDAFEKLQILPVNYVDTHPAGEIVSKVIADVDQFADGLLMGFTQFFTGIMTIIGTLVFMFIYDWKITMVVVLVTPASFFIASFIAKRTYNMFKKQSEARGEQTSLIDEMIGNEKLFRRTVWKIIHWIGLMKLTENFRSIPLMQPFFITFQSFNKICQQCSICTCGICGSVFRYERRTHGRISFGFIKLCQPVYETI